MKCNSTVPIYSWSSLWVYCTERPFGGGLLRKYYSSTTRIPYQSLVWYRLWFGHLRNYNVLINNWLIPCNMLECVITFKAIHNAIYFFIIFITKLSIIIIIIINEAKSDSKSRDL